MCHFTHLCTNGCARIGCGVQFGHVKLISLHWFQQQKNRKIKCKINWFAPPNRNQKTLFCPNSLYELRLEFVQPKAVYFLTRNWCTCHEEVRQNFICWFVGKVGEWNVVWNIILIYNLSNFHHSEVKNSKQICFNPANMLIELNTEWNSDGMFFLWTFVPHKQFFRSFDWISEAFESDWQPRVESVRMKINTCVSSTLSVGSHTKTHR